jgi:hypothetical protein
MKSVPVILLFLVAVVAVVAVLVSRPPRVALVPVPIHRAQARSAPHLDRPESHVRRVDLAQLERELRFRQVFRN